MPNIASLTYFIPELILCGVAVVLLCLAALGALVRQGGVISRMAPYVAAAGLVASSCFIVAQWGVLEPSLFLNLLVLDRPAVFFKLIFAATALAVVVFSQKSRELGTYDSRSTKDDFEYYALILGMVVGMDLLAAARNLLVIYLAIEFVGLMSYMLVGFTRNSVRSSEAALKYVLFGAVASGVFLFGASILYGLQGSLDLFAFSPASSGIGLASTVAGILILGGFLFKVAAVPMQAWCPDAYEGAPTPITALLSVAPKAAGFAVLMRVATLIGPAMGWPAILAVVSAATMTLGNLAAIPQTNAKRLLAYSSIAHAGYLLMGLACASAKGNEAVYFYFVAYLIMNLGAFLVVQIVSNRCGSDDISAFAGVGRSGAYGAFLGIAMTVFLLSLTGVPPFIGFIGKFYLFSAVIDAKLWWLAAVGIANSVVSLYYYMRIVKAIFFDQAASEQLFTIEGRGLAVLLAALAVATVVFGLAWSWIARLAGYVAA
ncbi:MAG: NADH-quinone oxidoreductase subunit N [Pseudomonadota bacterium]